MSELDRISPVHPGKIIHDDVLKPLGMSQNALATKLGVPANRINAIVRGLRSISADTALRLSRFLGTTPEFWLSLQMHYDLDVARDELATTLDSEVEVYSHHPASARPAAAWPDEVGVGDPRPT